MSTEEQTPETHDGDPAAAAVVAPAHGQPSTASEPAGAVAEAAESEAEPEGEQDLPPRDDLEWYVVNTFSGYENTVKRNLEQALKGSALAERIREILVPTEEVTERRGKKTRKMKRKFFPGYIFIHMVMDKATWHLVSNTPKVTGFLGGTNPRPVSGHEMAVMLGQATGAPVAPEPDAVQFHVGDSVRVKSGAFANFSGEVEEVNNDKRKIWLSVSIFGRPTRVEVDFSEVEPVAS